MEIKDLIGKPVTLEPKSPNSQELMARFEGSDTVIGPMTEETLTQAEREFRTVWNPSTLKWTVECDRGSRHEYGDEGQARGAMRILAILTATQYHNFPRPAAPDSAPMWDYKLRKYV